VELLPTPERLAAWFDAVGLGPIPVDVVLLEEAVALRTAIRKLVIAATVEKAEAPEASRQLLNRVLETGAAYSVLERDYTARTEIVSEKPSPLLPIANAALDLLTRQDLSLVRSCAGATCILLFLDTTKNKQRRWCRMSACGNREKVAAHYRRHHTD